MESAANTLVVVAAVLAVGFAMLRAATFGTQVMIQMFHSPADLGWPAGVQEDDDFHWRWSGRPAVPDVKKVGPARPGDDVDRGPGESWPLPEIVDLAAGSGPRPARVARH